MTTYTVTREQFNAHAAANRQTEGSMFHDDLGHLDWEYMEEEWEDAFDHMTTDLIWSGTVAHFTVTENSVTFTDEGFADAYKISEAVFNDYNGENGRSAKDADSPWVTYNLGGDDCVDECGTLPVIAMDMLSEVAKLPVNQP